MNLNYFDFIQNESREGGTSEAILSPESSLGSATSSGNISDALVMTLQHSVSSFLRRSELDAGESQSADDNLALSQLHIIRRDE